MRVGSRPLHHQQRYPRRTGRKWQTNRRHIAPKANLTVLREPKLANQDEELVARLLSRLGIHWRHEAEKIGGICPDFSLIDSNFPFLIEVTAERYGRRGMRKADLLRKTGRPHLLIAGDDLRSLKEMEEDAAAELLLMWLEEVAEVAALEIA